MKKQIIMGLILGMSISSAMAKDTAVNRHIFEVQPEISAPDINAFSTTVTNLVKQGFGVALTPRPAEGGAVADQPVVDGFYLYPKKINCITNFNQMRYTCDIEKGFVKYGAIPVSPLNAVTEIKYFEDVFEANENLTADKASKIIQAALTLLGDNKFEAVTIGKIGTVAITKAGTINLRCPYTIPETVIDLSCQEVFKGAVQIESATDVPDGSKLIYTPYGADQAGGTMILMVGKKRSPPTEITKNGVYQVALNNSVLEINVNLIGKLPAEKSEFIINEHLAPTETTPPAPEATTDSAQ